MRSVLRALPLVFVLFVVAAPVAAQPAEPCVYPYPKVPSVYCMGADGEFTDRTIELEDFRLRSVIVQASVGQPGRELAFVILQSLDDAPQRAVIEYAVSTPTGTAHFRHYRTLEKRERLAIGLHIEPETFGRANLSVTANFSGDGAMEMAWHRLPDFAEVASKPGVLVPRAPPLPSASVTAGTR